MEAYASKKKDAEKLKEYLVENFSKEKVYKQYADIALSFETEVDKEIDDLFSQLSIE